MTTISQNLQFVCQRIGIAERLAGRPAGSVRLIAVSKRCSPGQIREAMAAGQNAFGENYLQEALVKQQQLQANTLEWHFIGPVQSNKSRQVATHFDWVHSLDRFSLAKRLSAQRPAAFSPLNVCIQVNLGDEEGKSGVLPQAVAALAQEVSMLPRLRLRGLMCIPEAEADTTRLSERFASLRRLREQLNSNGLQLDHLSMGMSHDLELAINEGATMVRIGTAIFGARGSAIGEKG